jgi:hypothetical protein
MKAKLRKWIVAQSALILLFAPHIHLARAQGLTVELFGGTAWNLPVPLRIEQPGEEAIRFRARYHTRPWHGSPYYAYRVGYGQWSAELVHHKIYLQNPPPEIKHFEVSHGYNMAIVSRTLPFLDQRSVFRLGIGMVIGHPDGSIRGKAINPVRSFLGGGYHISGVGLQAAAGPPIGVADHWFFRPEAKLTAAWARMPLADGGMATVPNVALHMLLGFGYRSKR